MRLGVYVVALNPTYVGGLTTYALGLINGLLANQRGHDIVLFSGEEALRFLSQHAKGAAAGSFRLVQEPPRGLAERLTLLPGLEDSHIRLTNRRMRHVAERISAECDVVLFPLCFMATYRLQVPSIVSFHDLQHEVYPQFFSWRGLQARRARFGATFRHATLIQASSRAMKGEALRVYGDRLQPDRVALIPEGVDYATFSAADAEDARARYSLPDEFMLYPAQLWSHKNHLRLLEAIALLRAREQMPIALVLCGAEYEAAEAVRRCIKDRGLGNQVFMLGKVPFPSLRSLYRQASYVVSASLHESNSLPVLEAAASGTPLIVSNIPANLESSEVFQLRLFDPFDVENIAATLSEAWINRYDNQAAITTNRAAARQFDWAVVADRYIDRAQMLVQSGNSP